jgi:16S rRNA (guanine527-N7)-methyltransferase
LAALPALAGLPGGGTLLDIGSGAGFPGLVLAAARPDLAGTLVESRERKCAFLQAAARAMALRVTCLNARVRSPLPPGFPPAIDVVTVRAVRIDASLLEPLLPRLSARGRVLCWVTEAPDRVGDLVLAGRVPLGGARAIAIYETRR